MVTTKSFSTHRDSTGKYNLAENMLTIKKYRLSKKVVHNMGESADTCGRNSTTRT